MQRVTYDRIASVALPPRENSETPSTHNMIHISYLWKDGDDLFQKSGRMGWWGGVG